MGVILASLLLILSIGADEPAKPTTPRERYEVLTKEFEAATRAWETRSAGVRPEDPLWVKSYAEAPMWTFAPRLLEFAEANPEAPEAVDALLQVVQLRRTGRISDSFLFRTYTRCVEILIKDHLEDESVVQAFFTQAMSSPLNMEAYFRTLLEKSHDRDLLGRACMSLARCHEMRLRLAVRPFFDHPEDNPERASASAYLQSRRDREWIRYVRTTDPAALLVETESLLKRVVDEFGDIPRSPRWAKVKADGQTLSEAARRRLDAMQSIAVGKVAPEIEGEDVDGKPMKLSDFRGKVVVLVFWATWCGPCMGMIPHEKALVERYKDRPFALLGINEDTDRVKLKAAIAENGITWRSWWDGGRIPGPISVRWEAYELTSMFVLDAKGVIRFKRLPHSVPRLLDDAIDSLLTEMKP
jgi:thiol-disulfide isomerase/thioredoxin